MSLRFGHEDKGEGLIDVGRDGIAGDDTILLERSPEPTFCANDVPGARERHMRVEAIDRGESETVGDVAALSLIRDQVEAVAIVDLVQAEVVREAIGH
jgi:hypothetical protein